MSAVSLVVLLDVAPASRWWGWSRIVFGPRVLANVKAERAKNEKVAADAAKAEAEAAKQALLDRSDAKLVAARPASAKPDTTDTSAPPPSGRGWRRWTDRAIASSTIQEPPQTTRIQGQP